MQSIFPATWDTHSLFYFFGPRVFFAVFCGGLIGLEREIKSKAAGLKTNMLICLGSALYTGISLLIWSTFRQGEGVIGDPTRVAAQIVSGIGFLGGGAIIQSRGTVLGMTTAANIWVVAALGIVIGVGQFGVATGVALVVVFVLTGISFFERKIFGHQYVFSVELRMAGQPEEGKKLVDEQIERQGLTLRSMEMVRENDVNHLRIRYKGQRIQHKDFLLALWSLPGVSEVRHK